jgi:hypothetical protein
MRPNPFSKEQEAFLDAEGSKLRDMMKHEGWTVMSRLFKSTVEMYDSTHGLTTLKQVLARQDALAMMNAWMEMLVQRVSRLDGKEEVKRQVSERLAKSGMIVVSEEEENKDEAS